ncbi:hypothetical protein [Pseudomonas orientalis]|uniref:Uncharacterized protein n=1 Tax=Pseudomonas orientalis TaxID=76758 RepID=A0A8B3XWG5_9PSED|nr:hypothetical protein [Pseudomonas orientalis]SDT98498.1 hypothetical protein SAMN04490197_1697 [Pseudomonas orientalis]
MDITTTPEERYDMQPVVANGLKQQGMIDDEEWLELTVGDVLDYADELG